MADAADAGRIAALRRALREEQLGRPSVDDGFGPRFDRWLHAEAGRRVSVLATATAASAPRCSTGR